MSSMMDAIQGGGPPPAPGGGGGDLGGLLAGLGAPPQGGPPPPDPNAQDPNAGGEPAGDTVDVIKQMIDMAKAYLDAEDDDQEKAQMAGVLKTLQDFLAREQKEVQDAMGGKMSPRLLSKAYSG